MDIFIFLLALGGHYQCFGSLRRDIVTTKSLEKYYQLGSNLMRICGFYQFFFLVFWFSPFKRPTYLALKNPPPAQPKVVARLCLFSLSLYFLPIEMGQRTWFV